MHIKVLPPLCHLSHGQDKSSPYLTFDVIILTYFKNSDKDYFNFLKLGSRCNCLALDFRYKSFCQLIL